MSWQLWLGLILSVLVVGVLAVSVCGSRRWTETTRALTSRPFTSRAGTRGALVDNAMVMLPWEGSWAGYRVHGGTSVPTTGEAAWLRSDGRRVYFNGSVTSRAFEFAP